MVAFKYVVSEKLPPISYVTYIDLYVLFSFFTAFAIILVQVRRRNAARYAARVYMKTSPADRSEQHSLVLVPTWR
jgi:hypothetical protein